MRSYDMIYQISNIMCFAGIDQSELNLKMELSSGAFWPNLQIQAVGQSQHLSGYSIPGLQIESRDLILRGILPCIGSIVSLRCIDPRGMTKSEICRPRCNEKRVWRRDVMRCIKPSFIGDDIASKDWSDDQEKGKGTSNSFTQPKHLRSCFKHPLPQL